ncbi:MAG: sigma-70 family RNA polymerase sigma factor [Planctomycetota bacterium]
MSDADDPKTKRFRDLLDRGLRRWSGVARAYAAPADREDLVQEIALQVWRSLDGFRGDAGLDTYAYRVAINTALAWKRRLTTRRDRLSEAPIDVERLPGNAPNCGGSAEAVLDDFLASLSASDRAVMVTFLDDLSGVEAAEVLGISPGAYRVRLHRLRQRFESRYTSGGGAL